MSLFADLTEIPELSIVPDGEYDLRVVSAKQIEAKTSGRKAIMLVCDIIGEDNAENVFHKLWLPMESDSEEKALIMNRIIKEFLLAVYLPVDGSVELEDFNDLDFTAILGTDTYEGLESNVVKRII